MTIALLRKPPTEKIRADRLKVTFAGGHTFKGHACMFIPLKFRLRQEGIDNAGGTDLRIAPHDPCGHPLALFRDGKPVADYNVIINSPYHRAADQYRA